MNTNVQRLGARPEEWAALRKAVPDAHLLPVACNRSRNIAPNSNLTKDNIGKVPSAVNGAGLIHGVKGWPDRITATAEVDRWARHPELGISVRLDEFVAIDADCDTPAIAAAVEAKIKSHFPGARFRRRANTCRFVAVIKVVGDIQKRVKHIDATNMVELLARGQQFVAAGTHKSGARLEWDDGTPTSFVEYTKDQLDAFCADLPGEAAAGKLSTATGQGKAVAPPNRAAKLKAAASNDPVAVHLRDNGWVRASGSDGTLYITCIQADKHSTDSESSTAYFAAHTNGYERGHFDCKHASCAGLNDIDFLIGTGYETIDPEKADGGAVVVPVEILSVEKMLKRFVCVVSGSRVAERDRPRQSMTVGEFSLKHAASKTEIFVDNKKKKVRNSDLFIASEDRVTVDALAFDPSEARIFKTGAGQFLNLWKEPDFPRTEAIYARPFFDHMEYLIPDAEERYALLDWLAHAVQRPGERPHFHFLAIATKTGTGRSWVGELIRQMYGEHAREADINALLNDSFNSVLSGALFLTAPEVHTSARERFQSQDRLKSLLTDPTIWINEKHQPRWLEKFVARFLMFTNREDALPLSENDRRVYVIRCADEPRSPEYYTALYGRLRDGQFIAAVYHALRDRDISHFNPGARPPMSEAKLSLIAAGRSEVQNDAADILKHCPHDLIAANDLMRLLRVDFSDARDAQAQKAQVVASLRDSGLRALRRKVRVGGRVTRVWALRRVDAWDAANSASVATELNRGRDDFELFDYDAESIMQLWAPA